MKKNKSNKAAITIRSMKELREYQQLVKDDIALQKQLLVHPTQEVAETAVKGYTAAQKIALVIKYARYGIAGYQIYKKIAKLFRQFRNKR